MRLLLLALSSLLIHCGPPLTLERPKQNPSLQQNRPEEKWFKIIVLDVGQGDATLLISPNGEAAAIDTGPPDSGAPKILSVLKEQGVEEIKNIFISHYHEDHFGGLEAIVEALKFVRSKVIDRENAFIDEGIALGPVLITVKGANGQIGENFTIAEEARNDENNLSLALLVEYKNFRYFTDGDRPNLPGGGGDPPYVTIDLETPLAPLIGDIDIFLVPHHGSHTSSNENFLGALKPEAGIISVGNENEFFHPHPSVIGRLKNAGIKIYQTERGWLHDSGDIEIINGHICIVTNGDRYVVKPYAEDKCASPPALSN